MLEKVEKGKKGKKRKKKKAPENFVQVSFPHSPEIPGGLRPAGEGGRGFSLTYRVAKVGEIKKGITIEDREFLEVNPLVILAPITCTKKDPILLSMIPGNGHHVMKSIELAEKKTEEFLHDMVDFHIKADIQVRKEFFIGTLKSKSETIEEVALHIYQYGSQCAYLKNGQYYFNDGKTTIQITPFQYAIFRNRILSQTSPKKEAIRTTSAGQETEELFQDAVNSEAFWSAEGSKPKEFISSLENILTLEEGKDISEIPWVKKLSRQEKINLIFYLVGAEREKVVLNFLEKEELGPDLFYSFNGEPLINAAIEKGMLDLTQDLLSKDVDLNVQGPNKKSPLHAATNSGSPEVVEMLLDDQNIDVNVKDSKGWSPVLSVTMKTPDALDTLVKKGASLDEQGVKGRTALGAFVQHNMSDQVERLLKAGADPNKGNPSALVLSICSQNPELVKQLLDAGGKPFEKDQSGKFPFNEAIIRGTPEVVKLLFDRKDCVLDVKDKNGLTPMVLALYCGDNETIDALRKRGAKLPSSLEGDARLRIKHAIKRLDKLEDYKTLRELFSWNNGHCSDFDLIIVEYFLKENPGILEDLIREGYIDPNMSTEMRCTLFMVLCLEAALNFEKFKNLVQVCLDRRVDTNKLHGEYSKKMVLDIAVDLQSRELARMLLQAGADVSICNNPKELFNRIVELVS